MEIDQLKIDEAEAAIQKEIADEATAEEIEHGHAH